MDTGLNNRSTLGKVAPELEDIVFLVEATHNEYSVLWGKWSGISIESKPIQLLEKINSGEESVAMPIKLAVEIQECIRGKRPYVKWIQIPCGINLPIGYIDSVNCLYPVYISFQFAMINGKKIAFYSITGRYNDSEMVEKWLIERFQLTHDGYTRWNHTDATNFRNCINSLDNIDKEPRDTVYTGRKI